MLTRLIRLRVGRLPRPASRAPVRDIAPRARAWLAALLFAALLPLLFAAQFEYRYYRWYAWSWELARSDWDRALLCGLLWWKSLYVISPLLAVCGLLAWRRRLRSAAWVSTCGVALLLFWLAIDLRVQHTFGSHALEFLPYLQDVLTRPTLNHTEWAGSSTAMCREAVLTLLGATAAAVVFWQLCRLAAGVAVRWMPQLARPRGVALCSAGFVLALAGYVPLQATADRPVLLREAKAALPVDVSAADQLFHTSWLRRMAARTKPRGVQIVSLLPNPVGLDDGREEVYLHNFTSHEVDVSGWSLHDAAGSVYSLQGTLPAGRTRTFRLSDPGGLRLDNTGDTLELRDRQGHTVHEVVYDQWAKYGTLVHFRDESGLDDFERQMDTAIHHLYVQHHAALHKGQPVEPAPPPPPGPRPNVIYIVLESFRHTAVSPEVMSRLEEWGKGGLRLRRHYAGSNSSHLGLFALTYGRSPLVFDATLDRHVPPQTTHTLRRWGYEHHFLTSGDCRGFRRMDEFLNEQNFDHVVIEQGENWRDWPQRDGRLLQRIGRIAEQRSDKPQFILAFLMSTHFPYSFPPEFDRRQPSGQNVDRSNWSKTPVAVLHNRYKNAALYLEDQIMRLIDNLDPQRNLIVITGDHGESMGEDGALAHCTRGSEIQSRVPFLMVGAGVPAREVEAPTTHSDALPTLLHALSGRPAPLTHAHGRDLLSGQPLADQVLLCPHRWTDPHTLILVRGKLRLKINVRLDRPHASVFGFCDEAARLDLANHVDCSPEAVHEWSQAFREEMARVVR